MSQKAEFALSWLINILDVRVCVCVCVCVREKFSLSTHPLGVCVCVCERERERFFHSSVDRHLGCFHVLAVINYVAVIMGVRISL